MELALCRGDQFLRQREVKGALTRTGPWVEMIETGVNWGSWLVGVHFDTEPLTLFAEVGPFWIEAVRDEPLGLGLPCAWTMLRMTVARLKLDVRLNLDLNYWAVGYAAADARDHGVYLGPLNLQVEIDMLYCERDFGRTWAMGHA